MAVVSEFGVTKAEPENKVAAGSFTGGEIGVTKAEEVAGKGVVTEKSWIEFVFLTKPPEGIIERNAEPTGAMITKEMVPDSFIDILKKRPLFPKLPPVDDSRFINVHSKYPELRDGYVSCMTRRNYCVDLHEDILKQHAKKGFAEVGVDFTEGVKKIFILPQPQPQVMMMMQQGNSGGGRSTTALVFSGFAMIVFAFVVLLLSCLPSHVIVQV